MKTFKVYYWCGMCFFETSNLLVTRVTNAKDVVNNNNNISNNKYIPLLLMC